MNESITDSFGKNVRVLKMYEGRRLKLRPFLTSPLDGGKLSGSRLGGFIPGAQSGFGNIGDEGRNLFILGIEPDILLISYNHHVQMLFSSII